MLHVIHSPFSLFQSLDRIKHKKGSGLGSARNFRPPGAVLNSLTQHSHFQTSTRERFPHITTHHPKNQGRAVFPRTPALNLQFCSPRLGGLGDAALPKLPASNNLKLKIQNQTSLPPARPTQTPSSSKNRTGWKLSASSPL